MNNVSSKANKSKIPASGCQIVHAHCLNIKFKMAEHVFVA